MKTSAFTVRVPSTWAGRVDSARVRRMLADWFHAPKSLPDDPGPGEAFLRLSVPARPVRTFAAALGEEPSVALRRLIAGYAALPAASSVASLRSAEPRAAYAPSVRPVTRIEVQSRPILPALKLSTEWVDMACLRCNAVTRHERVGGQWECVPCREGLQRYQRTPQHVVYASSRVDGREQPRLSDWWQRWGWVVVTVVVLVGGFVLFKRLLGGKSAAVVDSPVAMPVSEGFVVWVPRP